MRIFAVLLLSLLPHLVWAACPPHHFANPKSVRLNGDSMLIVTHATSFHDSRLATKRGVDEAVAFAKRHKIPVVYLQDTDTPAQLYFMDDCKPDYWVESQNGEVPFAVTPSHVYVVGGHLELCLSETLHGILESWAKQPKRNLTMTFLMDGIYSNGHSIDPSDPFYDDFEKFMGVVTYRRPGGEHWPKLSLLETMGVIRSEEHEFNYLKSVLPHYARTMPADYRVTVRMNDSVSKVLQSAPGWKPPTRLFQFIDSAVDLEDQPG